MSKASDALSTLVNIYASPAQAFRTLQERPYIWLPLLLMLVGWIVLFNWYYAVVDFNWVVEHLIGIEQANAPADQHAQIAKNLHQLKPGAFVIISVLSVFFILAVVTVINTLYLLVVGAINDDKPGLKEWFSFSLWTSMPSLVLMLAMVANFYLSGSAQVAPEQLNPLTLNNLFFHLPADSAYRKLFDSLDLTILWSAVLGVIGYHIWTGRSWGKSVLIILAPTIAIYGTWFVLASLK